MISKFIMWVNFQLTHELRQLYSDNLIIQVLSSIGQPRGPIRKSRSLLEADKPKKTDAVEVGLIYRFGLNITDDSHEQIG